MSETKVTRRSRGEDAIYFASAKNRYVGSVSLGYGPDGKRIRRKVFGKTKQEVRDELKNMEGDPLIKHRRRQIQQRIAMQRVRMDTPKADVVVTNPTHYAVALKYDATTMLAPRVLVKGKDLIAGRIRQIAQEHGIPIVERIATAHGGRLLLSSTPGIGTVATLLLPVRGRDPASLEPASDPLLHPEQRIS